ncbi:hypothetical protein PtB15_7B237 [Puccinia triticina]|nr:hypothetical protein PtB15_7B237 [Puccinia triticina]
MFSVNRFDPNQQQQQQQPSQENTFNPLSRLNQRLQEKNSTAPAPAPAPAETESTHERPTTASTIHADRQAVIDKPEPSLDLNQPLTKKQKARLKLGFTGANTIPLPSLETPKPKSSAKLKYLKRKKERKKSRKRTTTTSAETKKTIKQEPLQSTSVAPADQTSEPENHEKELCSDPPLNTTAGRAASTASNEDPPPEKPKRAKRPKNLDVALEKISKKKKKRNREPTPDDQEERESKAGDQDEDQDAPRPTLVEEISQPGALPRFPAPTNPSLPDPQLLARLAMGLGDPDPAEIADPQADTGMVRFDSAATLPLSQLEARASAPGQFIQALSLSPQSISRLKQLEFENLLAVQIAVFSILMPPLSAHPNTPASSLYPSRRPPRDLCVSAPTGSGKTLSYIVPIVETLSSRVVCRLRALIVLPTRDLVLQVKNTFDCFSKGTGLNAAIITGQHSFTKEQAQLSCSRDGLEGTVDVVIATPGRLIDHLNSTPGFSLQHLCFLVLDEADQLLNKSQAWLHQVLSTTTNGPSNSQEIPEPVKDSSNNPKSLLGLQSSEPLEPSNLLPSHLSDDPLPSFFNPDSRADGLAQNLPIETYNPCRLRPFRILLFSATLRRDPVKLAHLGLRRPVFVKISTSSLGDVGMDNGGREGGQVDFVDQLNSYSLPKTLKQHIVVTRTDLKPLVFFKLVQSQRIEKALCFCKSIDGARRLTGLCRLMAEQLQASPASTELGPEADPQQTENQAPNGGLDLAKLCRVECFSSDLSPADRKKILQKFQSGEINMLICSDIIARGIDIAGVQNVVNYDSPIDIKKYVHRVGRTARANEQGRAFTLVESQEAKFVKGFLKTGFAALSPDQQVVRIRIDWLDLQALSPAYNIALKKLGDLFGRSIDL